MNKKEPGPPTLMLSLILGAILLWVLAWASGVSLKPRSDVTSVDIVTIVLASLGLIIAILTFFLGVVAFFGWSAFRTIMDERFEESVRKKFNPTNKEYRELLTRFMEDAKTLQETEATTAPVITDDDEKLSGEL